MNLGDGSEISDDTEDLVDLQEHGEKWSSSLGGGGHLYQRHLKAYKTCAVTDDSAEIPAAKHTWESESWKTSL